ncbi:hypothetical protein H0H10_21890 [Streptomyces sp. TRM S81-3]|uniref:Uncharacterized protein n=1 Tax=Streptomyces griseicoloratus TaxID=2752516 RepID=A0A926L812_9ACTN|nr:hypothetical protein [Streptomyces griseicoloratus]MBD0421773.1 hypothetical protein [Streptomyces griseicoloratus]
MLFERFRRKPAGRTPTPPPAHEPEERRWSTVRDGPDSDGMVTLSGKGWAGDLWRERPVRVPWRVDVGEFLGRRPLPYLWPDDAEYRAYVDADEDPGRLLRTGWIDAFLHHPDDRVVVQCLQIFTGENAVNLTSIADILGHASAPQVKQEAAKAVWRAGDAGVHWVFNVLLSRGLIPSDYDALSVHEAIGHLRRACPAERMRTLESELGGSDEED